MGSRVGIIKIAAKRCGLDVAEYESRIACGLKRCIKCKEWKANSLFNADASRYDGHAARCHACCVTSKVPSCIERRKMRSEGFEWCATCKAFLAKAVMTKCGKCKSCVNRERRLRYATETTFRNRLRQYAYTRKRKVDDVPPNADAFLTMLFDGKCAYCDRLADTWDHIHPVSKCGKTTPGNILPACRSCNSSKGDKEVHVWMESRGIEPSDLLCDRLLFQEVSLFG